jgi:hypothetical protein
VLGGYGMAALYALVLGRLLPLQPVDASLVATMASFVIYALTAVWSFAAATLRSATLGLCVPAALGMLILFVDQAISK